MGEFGVTWDTQSEEAQEYARLCADMRVEGIQLPRVPFEVQKMLMQHLWEHLEAGMVFDHLALVVDPTKGDATLHMHAIAVKD